MIRYSILNGFFLSADAGFQHADDLWELWLIPKSKRYNKTMSDFYTRTGDDGTTGLLGQERVPKHDPRVEAVGTLDEATAALGIARAACQSQLTEPFLLSVQHDLYTMMAEVAATPENAPRFRGINPESVRRLELQIEELSGKVQIPKEFILPGDSTAGAALSLARAVIRRAERRVTYLCHNQLLENPSIISYLNRLSSLCFILELYENLAAGKDSPTLAKATP